MVSEYRRSTFPKFIVNSRNCSGRLSALVVINSSIKIDAEHRNYFPHWTINSADNFPLNSRNNKPTTILSLVSAHRRTTFPKFIMNSENYYGRCLENILTMIKILVAMDDTT